MFYRYHRRGHKNLIWFLYIILIGLLNVGRILITSHVLELLRWSTLRNVQVNLPENSARKRQATNYYFQPVFLEKFCFEFIHLNQKKLQVIYLNKVQASDSGGNCGGKLYLHKALPILIFLEDSPIIFPFWCFRAIFLK